MDVRIHIRSTEAGERTIQVEAQTVVGEPSWKLLPDTEHRLAVLLEQLNKLVEGTEEHAKGDLDQIEQGLAEIGTLLFASLDHTDGYMRKILDARPTADNEPLRLELRIHDQPVGSWPWELLFDRSVVSEDHQREMGFLALSPRVVLSRYHELPIAIAQPEVLDQLRVLIITATTCDEVLTQIANNEVAALRLFAKRREWLHIEVLENASPLMFWHHLLDVSEPYHVIHFIGHGRFKPPAVGLVFADGRGGRTLVAAQDFALILRASEQRRARARGETTAHSSTSPYPRLVILDACHSSRIQQDVVSVTSELVNRGIPAIIGMRWSVSAHFARIFSYSLYTHLVDGLPIDLAVARCRKAARRTFHSLIDWDDPRSRKRAMDWTMPILHLRAAQGILFKEKPIAAESARWLEQLQLVSDLAGAQAAEATVALFKLGASAIALLVAVTLSYPLAFVRARAARLLRSIPRTSDIQDEIARLIGEGLGEEADPSVRHEMARLLAQPTVSTAAVPYLQPLMTDIDTVLREIAVYSLEFQRVDWADLTEGLDYLRRQMEQVSNALSELLEQVQRSLQENSSYTTYMQVVEAALQQARVLREQIADADGRAAGMSGEQMINEIYPPLTVAVSAANEATRAAHQASRSIRTLAQQLGAVLLDVEQRLQYELTLLIELKSAMQEFDDYTITSGDGMASIKVVLEQMDKYKGGA
jgi:hypothetical protein